MSTRVLYDSVSVQDIPQNAQMVAVYLDGRYANVAAVKRRCPHAQLVTITVLGKAGAHVADIEKGDLTPASGAAWAKTEVAAGRHPTLYCSASLWPAVQRAVRAAGISGRVSFWIAQYDNKPVIPTGAVAKQYRSTSKPNLDTSVVADFWPGVDPPKKVAPPTRPKAPAPHPAGPATRAAARASLLHRLHLHRLHLLHLLRRR